MGEFTVERPDLFPPGATVGIYRANGSGQSPDGPPTTPQLDARTVASDGTLEPFQTLDESSLYWAASLVGGKWRYMLFAIDELSPSGRLLAANPGDAITIDTGASVQVHPVNARRRLAGFANWNPTATVWVKVGATAGLLLGEPVPPYTKWVTRDSTNYVSIRTDTNGTLITRWEV